MLKVKSIPGKNHFNPSKSYIGDSGWNLMSTERKVLQPGETYRFMLGFSIDGIRGREYVTEDRSSMALKGLAVTGRIIDNGFTGEVSVILSNHNPLSEIEILPGDKIAQLVVRLIEDDDTLIVDGDNEKQELKIREKKGVGSSGQ